MIRLIHPIDKQPLSNSVMTNNNASAAPLREDIRDYVAELQLHMTLHARNLVPSLMHSTDSRHDFLREAQATAEKWASRQSY
jgi:hypothetical protein